jgi:transposase
MRSFVKTLAVSLVVCGASVLATKKAFCPKRIYRRRHKIENYFCRIKDWRRIATRYDKLARNYLAAAAIVGALVWIKL